MQFLFQFWPTFVLTSSETKIVVDKIPEKLPDSGRLQLIEMSPTEAQDVTPSQEGSTVNMSTIEESSVDADSKGNGTVSMEKEEQLKLYVKKAMIASSNLSLEQVFL